jgi:hypothetical protein
MPKASVSFWFIVVLIEIAFLILTFVEEARTWLFGPGPESFYVLLSTNMALLVIWVGLKAELQERRIAGEITRLTTRFEQLAASRPGVSALVDRNFYTRFGAEIGKAHVGVAMTHLDTHPPNRPPKTDAATYYASLRKVVRSSPEVRFRRAERASAQKREWLEELVSNFRGIPNFSLAVLLEPSGKRRLATVSVQLIDDLHAVLVAVAEHDSYSGPRDAWITDRDAASLWKEYYEANIWGPSVKVIENGQLVQSEWNKVLEYIDKQCPST